MIRRRWRLLLALTLLLLAGGLALVPGVRWPVYGWLRGEAFYRGMPSSWWEREVQEHYQLQEVPETIVTGAGVEQTRFVRVMVYSEPDRSGWLSQALDLLQGNREQPTTPVQFLLNDVDASALPVLLQLLSSDDERARLVALSGLSLLTDNEDAEVRATAQRARDSYSTGGAPRP